LIRLCAENAEGLAQRAQSSQRWSSDDVPPTALRAVEPTRGSQHKRVCFKGIAFVLGSAYGLVRRPKAGVGGTHAMLDAGPDWFLGVLCGLCAK
jgi:hypothetical protein